MSSNFHNQNQNQNTQSLSNEQVLLINILNRMYNDNSRQINSLNESNREIRNLITELLCNTNNNNRRSNNGLRRQSTNRSNRNTNLLNRFSIGDRIGTYYQEYLIPTTSILDNINANERMLNANNNFSRILQTFFDPVPIYPTPSQIESATRRVRYCDIVTPRNISCPISLEPFNDSDTVTVIRHCGHIFNTEQINNWFMSNCICPVCRYDIRNYNATNGLFNNTQQNRNIVQEETVERNSEPRQETNETITNDNIVNDNNINANTQYLIDFIYDLSGNFTSDGSDSNAIVNLLTTLLQRRNTP